MIRELEEVQECLMAIQAVHEQRANPHDILVVHTCSAAITHLENAKELAEAREKETNNDQH